MRVAQHWGLTVEAGVKYVFGMSEFGKINKKEMENFTHTHEHGHEQNTLRIVKECGIFKQLRRVVVHTTFWIHTSIMKLFDHIS